MILYPTETIYGLGAHALDEAAVAELFAFKGRAAAKSASWLVRDVSDIERFAIVSDRARQVIDQHLPGPVTIVLPARSDMRHYSLEADGTLSFRISSDPVAQQLIADFMAEHNAPLTCTSANVSGLEPQSTTEAIIEQFQAAGRDVSTLTIVDDGPRARAASTVVRIIGDTVEVLRQGAVTIT